MSARSNALQLETDYAPAVRPSIPLTVSIPLARDEAAVSTDRLHPGMMVAVLAGYLGLLGAVWMLFVSNIESGIAMAVNTAYFVMYFGVPLVMARIGSVRFRAPNFRKFLRGKFEVFDGKISGGAALAQMIVVPISLGIRLIAIGFIMTRV